jgi:hypothetical protein
MTSEPPALPGSDIKTPLPTVTESRRRIRRDRAKALATLQALGALDLADMILGADR